MIDWLYWNKDAYISKHNICWNLLAREGPDNASPSRHNCFRWRSFHNNTLLGIDELIAKTASSEHRRFDGGIIAAAAPDEVQSESGDEDLMDGGIILHVITPTTTLHLLWLLQAWIVEIIQQDQKRLQCILHWWALKEITTRERQLSSRKVHDNSWYNRSYSHSVHRLMYKASNKLETLGAEFIQDLQDYKLPWW